MRTIDRALAVFDCFTAERPSLSLQDIAIRVKLPKSTTFRVVQALENRGYLTRIEDQRYTLSFRFVQLGGLVASALDIRQVARPVMEKLARSSNESVTLSMIEGDERVCVDVVNTPSPLMTLTKPGERYRLGVGATSLMLIASLPPEQVDGIIRNMPRRAGGRKKILAMLETARKEGYAISHGGRIPGLSGIAVPVLSAEGNAQYCLSVVLPSVRAGIRIDGLLKLALDAGAELSRRFGAPNYPKKEPR